MVTKELHSHPNITIDRNEVAGLPPAEWESVIIATGSEQPGRRVDLRE